MAQAIRSQTAQEDPGRGLDMRKLGMWTFLGSEAFFFGALIATHLSMRGVGVAPGEFAAAGAKDLPKELFGSNILTSILAFVLLLSSLTMVLALDAAKNGNQRQLKLWLMATIVCGLFFLGGQVYEFNKIIHEGVTLRNSMFGSTFFTMTGFHGTHVLVGVGWLISLLISAWRGRYGPKNFIAIEIAGLYWHFVDLVWVAIFTLVYLMH